MLSRRQFLTRTLQGSSLIALSSAVPGFLANTAFAAEAGKDTVLVVIELSGGNDGLNTVIPYADDLYHKCRPTLRYKKEQVVKVNDQIGLHPALRPLDRMLQDGQLAMVQGVGYPNPDHSHFESMDIWQSADPRRKIGSGWLGRSAPGLQDKKGNVPLMQIGASRLPLAVQGAPGGVVSINDKLPYRLELGTTKAAEQKKRRKLIAELAKPAGPEDKDDLLQFVQRRQVQTFTTLERLEEVLKNHRGNRQNQGRFFQFPELPQKMGLVAELIQKGFGTRVFYVAIGNNKFDTHSGQAAPHFALLSELAQAIQTLFEQLKANGQGKRVLAMTFSEFGRRVQENGSKGTDHGSGSCLFVAGPAVKGGLVGAHPSLKDMDSGDLRFHTDFRRVYATLLDQWLGCDSKAVLGDKFEHLDLIKNV
jgi:uncharacterized protein (DUF1501 family)